MKRPTDVKIIVCTGPESTGKSTVAEQLADSLATEWVPEYARQYIDELDRPYRENDLLLIAKQQTKLIQAALTRSDSEGFRNQECLICDTDLLTIKIWAQEKYGHCPEWIIQQLLKNKPTAYLLFAPDIAWIDDPQRESRDDRDRLFSIYESEIQQMGVPCFVVTGDGEERVENAKAFLLYV